MKKCSKCGIIKPLKAYYNRKDSKDGHHHQCKSCIMNKSTIMKKKRDIQFKRKYGYTYHGLHQWVQYHIMKSGICIICNEYKNTEFANISGQYKRELRDFMEVCKPCHSLYDSRRGEKE